jgi:hypothetical protein
LHELLVADRRPYASSLQPQGNACAMSGKLLGRERHPFVVDQDVAFKGTGQLIDALIDQIYTSHRSAFLGPVKIFVTAMAMGRA